MHILFRGSRTCVLWLRLAYLFLNKRRLMVRQYNLIQGDVLVVLLFWMGWLALVPLATGSHLLRICSYFVIFAALSCVLVRTAGPSRGALFCLV